MKKSSAVESGKFTEAQVESLPDASEVPGDVFFGGFVDEQDVAHCGRRTRSCGKCSYRYSSKNEREVRACPSCGNPRPCGYRVAEFGRACARHGGASLKGTAAPSFKDGHRSKLAIRHGWLNAEEQEKVIQARREALELAEDIATADVLEEKLGERIQFGNVPGVIKSLRLAHKALMGFDKAQKACDTTAEHKALAKLTEHIVSGLEQADNFEAAHGRYMAAQDHRRRLVETEIRRQEQSGLMYPIDEILVLVTQLADLVKTHVSNPKERQKIEEGFAALGSGKS
jgi:hypothetical protein